MPERLDPAEQIAARHRISRRPFAGRAEDADRRRMHALGLLSGALFGSRGGCRLGHGSALARDRDREAVRLHLDPDAGQALGELDAKEVVNETEERIAFAQGASCCSGFRRIRRHHGSGGAAGTPPPFGSMTVPKARKRS